MLRVELKTPKSLDLSKSSFMDDEADLQKLRDLVEEQKSTIRKLGLKVSRLEQALTKERAQKGASKSSSSAVGHNEQLLAILKFEIDKSRETEQVLKKIIAKIQQLTNEIDYQGLINENPQKISQKVVDFDAKHYNLTSLNKITSQGKQAVKEILDRQSVFKQLSLLQAFVRSVNEREKTAKLKNQQLVFKNKQVEAQMAKETQNRTEIQKQLEMERKTRIKLKRLLQKSQCEKNDLMIRIEQITLKEKDLPLNNRDQWLRLSKSLTFRISDLQGQKKQLKAECMREKQVWRKKYGQLLKTVRSLQLTRR